MRLAKFELAVYAIIVLACSQLGYVGHPRYGPFIAAADVLCAVLVVGWALKMAREGRLRHLLWPPTPVWAWLVVCLLSMSRSMLEAEGSLSLSGIKSGLIEIAQIGLYFVGAYMMFVGVLNSVGKVRRACWVLLGATTLAVAWGVVDYLLQTDPLKVRAGFGNRNAYSAFLAVVLPLLGGLALYERDKTQRGWVAVLVAAGVLTMLGPPHVWILLGIMCWLAYVRGGRARSHLLPIFAVCGVMVVVGLPRNRLANVDELLDIYERGELYKLEVTGGDEEGTEGQVGLERPPVKKRWIEWQPALMMMTENFPLGVGAGCYQSRIGEYYASPTNPDVSLPDVKKSEADTNNLYLVTAGATGFSGLVCLIAYLAWGFRQAGFLWLRAGSATERGLAMGLTGAVASLIAANLFTSLFVRGTGLVWALLFAMVTVASREGIVAAGRERPESGNG